MDLLWLSFQHIAFHRLRSSLLVMCLAVTLTVPLAATILLARYDSDLRSRASATPLLLGSRGNRFDLVLATLYWRSGKLEPLPWEAFQAIAAEPGILAVPIHVGFAARGRPIVATGPEYFEQRGLLLAQGTTPLQLGEATLGADLAEEWGLALGDTLFSDPSELYDLTRPSSLRLTVVGVLAPTGGPDDAAVFTDTKTAWVMEGLFHGHEEANAALKTNPDLELGRSSDRVSLSGALLEHNRIDPSTSQDFHLHGDPAQRPLSAVLLWPANAKAGTLAKARINAGDRWRVITPARVVDELLAAVLRAKRLFDSVSWFLVAAALLLTALVLALSTRLRTAELRTMDRIGCTPGTIPMLIASEAIVILGLAAALAGLFVSAAVVLAPRLVQLV